MNIIKEIFTSKYFDEKPPVLFDIGASGEINAKWKQIAKYSICICFDADSREFSITENEKSKYKKLIQINRIVTAEASDECDFYLTSSPFCSSSLEPEWDKLQPWIFQPLFKVEEKIQLKSITVAEALQQAHINYIDWFKTDSQGTDLRLFLSTPKEIIQKTLAVEFEPGLIDAYKGEDKLYEIIGKMTGSGFWLSDMKVKGAQRLDGKYKDVLNERLMNGKIRNSPCWAELTYLHEANFTEAREMLLLLVFSLIEKQYGFALEICDTALLKIDEPLFAASKEYLIKKIKSDVYKNKFKKIASSILRRVGGNV